MFQQRTREREQQRKNSAVRSDISVDELQQLSKAGPPGAYFLSASLQQLAEMSCLGREANAALLISSPSNPAAPTPHPPIPPPPPCSVTLSPGQSFQYFPHSISPPTNWKPAASLCFFCHDFSFFNTSFVLFPLRLLPPQCLPSPFPLSSRCERQTGN